MRANRALDRVVRRAIAGPKPPVERILVDREERRIVEALSMLGDECVEDFRNGRLSYDDARAIADQRDRDMRDMRWL